MKTNQVPEAREMEMLFDYLCGKEDFESLRGEMKSGKGAIEVEFLFDLIDKTKNPTQFLKILDAYFKKIRFVGNTLATLKRDGRTLAIEEMKKALTKSSYLMRDEVVPLNEMVTVTVVVPQLKLSLPYISYQRTDRDPQQLRERREGYDVPSNTMIDQFALNLKQQAESNFPCGEKIKYGDLYCCYSSWVTASFKSCFIGHNILCEPLLLAQHAKLRYFEQSSRPNFGFIFKTNKKELLKMVPRTIQKSAGIWEFKIPKRLTLYRADMQKEDRTIVNNFFICFYPQQDKKVWAKKEKTFHAPNTQFDFRAFITPCDQMDNEFLGYYNSFNIPSGSEYKTWLHSPGEKIVFVLR